MKRPCPSCEARTISPLGLFGFRKATCAECGARVGPHWLISNVMLHTGAVIFVTALFVTVKFLGWTAGAMVIAAWVLFEIAYKSLVPLEIVAGQTPPDNEGRDATTAWKQEVEQRMEHDCRDAGGRVLSGTRTGAPRGEEIF